MIRTKTDEQALDEIASVDLEAVTQGRTPRVATFYAALTADGPVGDDDVADRHRAALDALHTAAQRLEQVHKGEVEPETDEEWDVAEQAAQRRSAHRDAMERRSS